MVLLSLLFLATCFLAYSDGANDNSKGVATLFGSGTTNYKVAIGWATGTTFLGSICSIFLAATLVSNFSGKGLVPDAVAAMPQFLLAVAIGAGVTVLLATLLGFPVSTTHSLVGALTGAGFVAAGTALNIGLLGNRFFLPLLLSPLIAAGGLLGARKVAETISHRITRLNHGHQPPDHQAQSRTGIYRQSGNRIPRGGCQQIRPTCLHHARVGRFAVRYRRRHPERGWASCRRDSAVMALDLAGSGSRGQHNLLDCVHLLHETLIREEKS